MTMEPKLEYRKEQPYVAVRAQVGIPFGDVLGGFWDEANAFLASKGLTPSGPPLFVISPQTWKRNLILKLAFQLRAR